MNQSDRCRYNPSTQQWRYLAGLLGIAALAATAACTDSGGGSDDGADGGSGGEAVDAAALVEMVNESARLDKELARAEDRIIAECLAAQGFTVHDLRYMGQYEPHEVEALTDFRPTDEFLPEVDVAAEWGFGWWAETAEMFDSQETQDYYEATWAAEYEDEPVFDNSDFESLPSDEQRAWSVAYQGEEATAGLEYTGEAPEDDTSSDDGSLEFGDGAVESIPKPGGCQLEMIEALYGEPQQVAVDEEGDLFHWVWRPEMPLVDVDAIDTEYAARMVDAQPAFLTCTADRGYPGWEFNETGRLAMRDYSSLLYTGEIYEEEPIPGEDPPPADTNPPVPDLPEDVPADFEDKRAYEVEMAVAFAECGDESGYRETATATYDAVTAEQYAAIEVDMYAWQDEIRGFTTKAQELIAS
ncbi:hypothetical protein [Glycomyces rhizosphaerae]|uniref:Uncharacterized protein n=1 Tax=Glycomyces rhizosphaerae TaxID=2054422 RepID=A0ABV7Q8J9_9ACTN